LEQNGTKLEEMEEKEVRKGVWTKKNRNNSRNSSRGRILKGEYYHNPRIY